MKQQAEKQKEKEKGKEKGKWKTADDLRSLNSFDVFTEDNMEPLTDFNVDYPRRDLQTEDFYADTYQDKLLNRSLSKPANETIGITIKKERLSMGESKKVTLATSKMDYWILSGTIAGIREYQKKSLYRKLPGSFLWLLQTAAQTINVDPCVIYENLLALEIMYHHGIEKLDEPSGCLRFTSRNPIKDIKTLTTSYREIW